jgi:hypothetical protein
MSRTISGTLITPLVLIPLALGAVGCSGLGSSLRPEVAEGNRAAVAVLPFTLGVEVTKLSSVQTVADDVSPEQEAEMIANAKVEIPDRARHMLHEALAKEKQFTVIPLDRTDQAVADMKLKSGTPLSAEQAARLRERLGADLVVGGTVQDYGKVRWQWLAAGMVGDMTWESLAIGAATSWNPAVIFGNIGFELLTSTPVWFGGGYLFGVAFSPVRVDAWAVETQQGRELWAKEEIGLYVWRRLKTVPEEDRKKKEVALRLNLQTAMEDLTESLLDEELTRQSLRSGLLEAQDIVAF